MVIFVIQEQAHYTKKINLFGASFSIFCANILNSSNYIKPYTESQAVFGNQFKLLSVSGFGMHLIKKSIYAVHKPPL